MSDDLVLIVGGPHDGKRVAYAGETMTLVVVKPLGIGEATELNPLEVTSSARYCAHELRYGDAGERWRGSIYVPDGMSPVDAMTRLLKHYKPGGK